MNIPNIKDLVQPGKRVTFVRYHKNDLWYRCDDGFEFPVNVSDTNDAEFLAEDKAITYMRWIRKHIDNIKEGLSEAAAQ
jgi:hypothetical protein